MPELNYVVPELRIIQEARFSVVDLYKVIKDFFDLHEYDFYEKEYIDKLTEGGKNISVKWETEKKADDYTIFHIELRIKFKNLREVAGKKKLTNEGQLNIKFESFLELDYEGTWEKNFFFKFIRAIYDKFILADKLGEYEKELREQTYDIYNKVKAFLKLHQYKS